MTKKEFKEALLRGHGRCIQAVHEDPEKYRKVVLWACGHVVAFDPQCEGCRSVFVYELISHYPDRTAFIDTLIDNLRKAKSQGGWKVLYLAEVLSYFAADGEQQAQQALWAKYEELYGMLLTKKRLPNRTFPELDDYAMLCQVLGHEKSAMIKIAGDIGKLYRVKTFYDGDDFLWLFDSCGKKILGTLKKQAQKSENIAAYLFEQERVAQIWEERIKQRNKNPIPPTGLRLSRWLRSKAGAEAVQSYASSYLSEKDPDARTQALFAFARCPFPGDPTPILEDANSTHLPLKQAAWQALENIRHPLVREFALEQIQSDMETALPVLLVNYQPQDEEMLVRLIKSIPVDFACTTFWHGAQLDVLNMEDHGLKAPKELLYHIYETSYCSCCREHALGQMGKRRLLTNEILEECLLDSNTDIRSYARNIVNRRKNRRNI